VFGVLCACSQRTLAFEKKSRDSDSGREERKREGENEIGELKKKGR
jgi:hypothetical protein